MFDRFLRRKPEPLTGAPATPRLKTYTAASGYVYQYFYRGMRAARRKEGRGTEYVFEVSMRGGAWLPVAVFLPERAAASWEARKGRALIPAERYAISKMALFHAFDQCERPAELSRAVAVDARGVDGILDSLGID